MSIDSLSLADAQALAIVATVLAVTVAERCRPRVGCSHDPKPRWGTNIALLFINLALVAVPLSYLMGRLADPQIFSIPGQSTRGGAGALVSWLWWFLVLDLASYFLHRSFHSLPLLYRIHCAHHSDRAVDLTTSFRRHPVEFFLNAALTCTVGIAIGTPLDVVGIYGIAAGVLQIWHHGNLAMPESVDRALGKLIVTPALHRSHHALGFDAANCNYGAILSVWDRIFHTLHSGPEPHEYGVGGLTGPEHQRLGKVLLSPLLFDPRADEP
jgi:sterol desaturase/sphingolipid hydroxylase (fatty acid hydroxylase superfamily)